VKAFVVLNEGYGRRVTEDELRRYCRDRLTPYKVPRVVEFRADLPVTVSGKLRRHELRDRAR
jgi:acyl-coenzyme A synthetase/AMP-(fatty) acid ligase